MKLIAHGCGPTIHPSNTIASAKEALAQGADLVELDVQFTADRRLAVFHDKSLEKRFGVDAGCGELSSEAFLALRDVCNPIYPSHLLDHFFQCGIAPILIHHPMKVSEAVIDLVEQYGYADRVVLGVGDPDAVRYAKSRLPGTEVLGFIRDPSMIEEAVAEGASYIRLWERWLTEENVRRVKESGAGLWVMCGGPQTGFPVGRPGVENLCRIAALEPDGILVNDIPWTKSVLAKI